MFDTSVNGILDRIDVLKIQNDFLGKRNYFYNRNLARVLLPYLLLFIILLPSSMPVYGNQSYSFRTQLYSPMGFSFKKKSHYG